MSEEKGEKPINKFSAGAVSVSVWKNMAKKGDQEFEVNSVTIQRGYKDKQGDWKNTNSLKQNDIPKAQMLLGKAYDFIVSRKQ